VADLCRSSHDEADRAPYAFIELIDVKPLLQRCDIAAARVTTRLVASCRLPSRLAALSRVGRTRAWVTSWPLPMLDSPCWHLVDLGASPGLDHRVVVSWMSMHTIWTGTMAEVGSYPDQARLAAVAIFSGRRFLGSGFFVQRGLVLTCAHAVWRQSDGVAVHWNGQELPGTVIVRDPEDHGGGAMYAHPDLSFIRVNENVDHPMPRCLTNSAGPGKCSR
jgi:Trypsin-like peptidase domain